MINSHLIKLAKNMGNTLFFIVLIGALSGALIIYQCYLTAKIINQVFLHNLGLLEVRTDLIILLIIIFLRFFSLWLGEIISQKRGHIIQGDLRQTILQHIFNLGPIISRQEDMGQLVTTITQRVDSLEDFFTHYLPSLSLAGIIPLGILIIVLPQDFLTAIILLVTAPLIPLFMILIGNLAEKWSQRQWYILGKMNSHFIDVINGLTTLKLLNRSLQQTTVIANLSKEWTKATMAVLKIAFLSAFFLEFTMTISTALIAVSLGLRLLSGKIGFQIAFFLLLLAPEFYKPLRNLGTKYHEGVSASKAAEDIFALLSIPLPHEQQEGLKLDKNAFKENLILKNISFAYTDNILVLKEINFSIQPGEKIALVGASGAGKSTVFQLLLGFIRPTTGDILLGENSLSQLDLANWRKNIAYVPQKPYLFSGTIADNISFGKPQASLAEIKNTAKKLGLHQIIMELPENYQTRIGGGGRKLSSGQSQLIALARAFILDAPFVFLDEATASLDIENEVVVQKALHELLKGRTAIVAAHRLATLESMDKILVLDNGEIVETGKHDYLLSKRKKYYNLFNNYHGITSMEK